MARLGQFTELSRKVVAVGRNYADHAKELGNAVPSSPLLFMKPPSAFVTVGGSIEVPPGCSSLHHEIELGVVVGRRCRRVTEEQAMAHIGGYCLALDMTARDRQEEAKAKGHPWTMAKVGVPPHHLPPPDVRHQPARVPLHPPGQHPRPPGPHPLVQGDLG